MPPKPTKFVLDTPQQLVQPSCRYSLRSNQTRLKSLETWQRRPLTQLKNAQQAYFSASGLQNLDHLIPPSLPASESTDPTTLTDPLAALSLQSPITPVKPPTTTFTVEARRKEDQKWCLDNLHGYIWEGKTIENILKRAGGDALVNRYRERAQNCRIIDDSVTRARECMKEEKEKVLGISWVSGKEETNYWINDLAALAPASSKSIYPPCPPPNQPKLHFVQSPSTQIQKTDRLQHSRQLDSALRPTTAMGELRWTSLLVPLEFTVTPLVPNALKSPHRDEKLSQIILNLVDLLAQQTERHFALGIGFHGVDVVLLMLDHSGLHMEVLANGLSSHLRKTCGLLSVLQSASVYELGLNPLIEYHFNYATIAPKGGYQIGDAVVCSIGHPWSNAVFNIEGPPINSTSGQPFSRYTNIIPVTTPSNVTVEKGRLLVKLQFVASDRLGLEGSAYNFLWDGNDPDRLLIQQHISKVVNHHVYSSNASSLPHAPRRHMEALIIDTVLETSQLSNLAPPDFLHVARQLVAFLEAFHSLGICHGDLSSGNVLAEPSPANLHSIDMETVKFLGSKPTSERRTGTLDTMACAALSEKQFIRHSIYELESAVYVLLKEIVVVNRSDVLTDAAWATSIAPLLFSKEVATDTLRDRRARFWQAKDNPFFVVLATLKSRLMARVFVGILTIAEMEPSHEKVDDPLFPAPMNREELDTEWKIAICKMKGMLAAEVERSWR